MGNIADALQKAGVKLDDQQPAEETGSADAPFEHVEPSQETSYQVGAVNGTANRTVRSVTLGPWNERINLVLNNVDQAAEAFRVLRSKILFPKDGKSRPRTIMVASSAPEEGKSFVSVNLAVAIAKGLDQYALLVDCDLRRPSLAGLLGLTTENNHGLTEYLREEAELGDLICRTTVDKLSLLPSGSVPQNPAELLTSVRMSRLVNELSGRYSDRFIIFDSPPFQIASESLVLAKNVDGVVLVIGYGKGDRTRVRAMIDTIGQEKVLGVVFNGQKESYLKRKMFDPYGSYGKYYHYSGDRK